MAAAAEREDPGPNATLSLWGEAGEPEGYDPGAPTGPVELVELAGAHQMAEEAPGREALGTPRRRSITPRRR